MKKEYCSLLISLIFLLSMNTWAQNVINDSSVHAGYKNVNIKSFAIPAAFMIYGLLSLEYDGLKNLNVSTKEEIREHNPFFKSSLDNYLQFVPAATVFGFEAFGIKGEHSLKNAALLYSGIIATNTTMVFPLKKITHVMRPDSSGYTSFPSGHTSTAFASAEFLRREYGRKYPWLAVAGYTIATGTGVYRMLNNKHWLGDIVAGAGIGIASANLGYWLFNKLQTRAINSTNFYYPVIRPGSYGIGLIRPL